ncbi:Unknown protein, partial [Striga hermonthica]
SSCSSFLSQLLVCDSSSILAIISHGIIRRYYDLRFRTFSLFSLFRLILHLRELNRHFFLGFPHLKLDLFFFRSTSLRSSHIWSTSLRSVRIWLILFHLFIFCDFRYKISMAATLNPTDDPSSPYFLHASDNPGAIIVVEPFNGENYVFWSRSVLMALSVKNKGGFVDGTILSPSPTDNPTLYVAWVRSNNLVLSWVLNSISKEIRQSLLFFTSAREVWDEIKNRYAMSSGPRVFQLEKSLSTMDQGSLSIT